MNLLMLPALCCLLKRSSEQNKDEIRESQAARWLSTVESFSVSLFVSASYLLLRGSSVVEVVWTLYYTTLLSL